MLFFFFPVFFHVPFSALLLIYYNINKISCIFFAITLWRNTTDFVLKVALVWCITSVVCLFSRDFFLCESWLLMVFLIWNVYKKIGFLLFKLGMLSFSSWVYIWPNWRMSLVSLHSFPIEDYMCPCAHLVDREGPSFAFLICFLMYLIISLCIIFSPDLTFCWEVLSSWSLLVPWSLWYSNSDWLILML